MSKPVNNNSSHSSRYTVPIGIDFGTTNSAMSRYNNSLLGSGPVSCNFPNTGSVLYPSMALLDRVDGTIRTGNAAYTHRLTNPEDVIVSVKRKILENNLYELGTRNLSNTDIVESIITGFLNEVKLTDHDFQPSVVTLTVPYYFGENENALILEAAQKALFSQLNYTNEVFLLPEPVAASIGSIFKLLNEEFTSKLFFVYDIGGGTLDLTLVRISNNSNTFEYEVLATDGINKFGGDDIDNLIYDYVIRRESLDFSQLDSHQQVLNRARLLEESKEAKHHLTSADKYFFMCSCLFGIENGYVELEMTRDLLNSILSGQQGSDRDMFSELNECINRLYYKSQIAPESVDFIVPVGGTSFVPLFRNLMTELHPHANELCGPNLMDNLVLVANGASIYSAMKCDELFGSVFHPFRHANSLERMKTRVSHALYLEKFNGKLDLIIESNSVSPAVTRRRYYPSKFKDGVDVVDLGMVNLYQGQGTSRKDKRLIGSIDFSDYAIYSHGRQLDSIPVDLEIIATDTLVKVSCCISKGGVDGQDIKFQQIIHK